MSEFGNQITNKCNREDLFPLHLYQETAKQTRQSQQTLLDENYHDQSLPSTLLQQAKSSLKIGKDTHFETPIEKFGTKILENLGWKEGCGIGKDSQMPNAPIEYIPRQFRLGLGAQALTLDQITNKKQKTVTDNYEQSSIGKNIKRVGEQLTVKKEIELGSNVKIIDGAHKGLSGQVVAMKKPSSLGDESKDEVYISVLLKSSGSVVQVKQKRLELKRDRSRSPEVKSIQQGLNSHYQSKKRLKWLHEGIIVRCISRDAHQGKLYGKELEILTIFDDKNFEARVEGKIYRDLNEKELETVLPTSKQLENQHRLQVMLLRGSKRGQTGKVLSVDKKKDVVNVQLDYTEILQVSQDDVSCLIQTQ